MGLVFVSSYSILLFDTISFSPSSSSLDEASLPNNTPAPELYSSGAAGGYSFTKPFVLSNTYNNTSQGAAYIGSDGYLYAKGTTWGTSWYKQSGAFGSNTANTGVGYELNYNYGITLDTSGVVRVGAATTAASTTTWSTVTVGGVTSGHQAVAISTSYQMVVAANGAVYVGNDGVTSLTSIAISAATATANGGVKDIAMGRTLQYVLFNNGSLWGGTTGSTSMSSIATGVTMFDFDGYSSYIYAYDTSNNMKYATPAGSGTHSWTTLGTEAGVKQIVGGNYQSNAYAGWGYINSAGTFKQYYSPTTKTSSSATLTISSVAYIDCSSNGVWGYLNTSGQMYLWNSTATSTAITSNTSPGLSASLGSSRVPDLGGGISDISSTPPTALD